MSVDGLRLVRDRMERQRIALELAIGGATYRQIGSELDCSETTAQQLVGAALTLAAVADDRLVVDVDQEQRVPLCVLPFRGDRLAACRRDPALAQAVLDTHDRVALLHRFTQISALADLAGPLLTDPQRADLHAETAALVRDLTGNTDPAAGQGAHLTAPRPPADRTMP